MEDGCGQGSCDCWSWFSLVLRGFKARLVRRGFGGGRGWSQLPVFLYFPSVRPHTSSSKPMPTLFLGVEVLRVDQSGQSEFSHLQKIQHVLCFISTLMMQDKTYWDPSSASPPATRLDSDLQTVRFSWTRRSKQAFIEGVNTLVSHTESE